MDYHKLLLFSAVSFLMVMPAALASSFNYEYSDIRANSGCSYYTIENLIDTTKIRTLNITNIKNVYGRIYDGSWQILVNHTYYETNKKLVKTTCEKYETPNKTIIENCFSDYQTEQSEKWRWNWVSPFNLKPSTIPKDRIWIRWCARIEREFINNAMVIKVDHVPFFDGISYSALQWWDSSYGYRYQVFSNSSTMDIISVNDTFGIGGKDIIWTNNATGGEDIFVYCENIGCSSGGYAIGNHTHQKFWFNETDGTGNNPNSVSNSSLLSWWTFNNATGTDVSGNNRNLSIYNNPEVVNAVFGKGSSVHEVDNFWSMTDAESSYVEGQPRLTVSIWVWLNQTEATFHPYFIYKDSVFYIRQDATRHDFSAYIKTVGGDNSAECYSAGVPADEVLKLNTWHHIVMTYDGTTMRLYQNGTFKCSDTANGNLAASAFGIYVGSDVVPNVMKGMVDDYRIYNIALSQKEIQDIYYQGRNNHTNIDVMETAPIPAVDIDLFLNGTQGNVSYLNGSFANLTVSSNVTALVNLTTNITGWQDLSAETPYYNYTQILCTANETYYNITAFGGNSSYSLWENETHYAICWFPAQAIEVSLALNGTAGNVNYLNGSYANFTGWSNTTALINMTSNMSGWVNLSQMSPIENYTFIICAANGTVFNISVHSGNGSYSWSAQSYFAVCYVPTPAPPIEAIDYCQWLWAEKHGEKLANDNWCISNDTLARNISYSINLDGNVSNMTLFSTEVCRFGCDNRTNACNPNPVELNWYFGGGILLLLVIIGIIYRLWGRW